MGALFPLPRVLYAMAKDGIIFPILGKLQKKFQTPVVGTLLAGGLTGNFKKFVLINIMSLISFILNFKIVLFVTNNF